jgi:hypothetical protein
MLLALISFFQTTPISPPITPPAPPAPPVVTSISPGSRWTQSRPLPRYVIDVDASANGKTLWRGSLRMGAPSGANFQRTLTEAPPEGCPISETVYSGARDSFRVQLGDQSRAEEAPRQSFNVEWQRPSDQCTSGITAKTVQLSGTLQLKPGQSVTVEGDAGLALRFTRR